MKFICLDVLKSIYVCSFIVQGGVVPFSMICNQITWSSRPDSGTVSWYICLEVNKIGLVQFFSFRKIDTSDKLLNFRDLCFPGSLSFKLQMTPLYTLPVVFQIATPSGSSFAWINLAIDTPSRDKLKKQWQCGIKSLDWYSHSSFGACREYSFHSARNREDKRTDYQDYHENILILEENCVGC